MYKNKQKKPLGFLSVVAFLMILAGIGYTVSSVFAVSNPTTTTSPILPETQSSTPKENVFSSLEAQVADKATTLRNNLLGTTQDAISSTVDAAQLPETNHGTTSSDQISSVLATATLATPLSLPLVYEDIQDSAYKDAILILYSNNIIQWGKQFYPNNYVRISDFIRVVMDAYRLQQWFDTQSLEGLSKNEYFSFPTVPTEVTSRVNSAYELWFLQKLVLENADGSPRLSEFIRPSEAKDILLLMRNKSPSSVQYPTELSYSSEQTLSKQEMAQIVVSAFNIKLNERSLPVFSDTSGTPYQEAIQLLAKLRIVSWVQGRYYPNARVENKDFVIMISRILMLKHNQSSIPYSDFYYLKPIQNVPTNATYAPYLEYCLGLQICNSLLTQTSQGVIFEANRLLSRSEINAVLSIASEIKFSVPSTREWDYLTRGELAHLFVNVFALDTKPWEKSESPSLSSGQTLSDNKTRRETFQELMKIS